MSTIPLLAISFIITVVAVVWFICAVVLILVVLIQKGKGGGLSSAFGGGTASGLLGSKTGDFLTWATIALVGIFILLSVTLAKYYRPTVSDFDTGQARQAAASAEKPAGSEQPVVPVAPSGPSSATDVNTRGG
jgi:preprotein translocase subunit SecG